MLLILGESRICILIQRDDVGVGGRSRWSYARVNERDWIHHHHRFTPAKPPWTVVKDEYGLGEMGCDQNQILNLIFADPDFFSL